MILIDIYYYWRHVRLFFQIWYPASRCCMFLATWCNLIFHRDQRKTKCKTTSTKCGIELFFSSVRNFARINCVCYYRTPKEKKMKKKTRLVDFTAIYKFTWQFIGVLIGSPFFCSNEIVIGECDRHNNPFYSETSHLWTTWTCQEKTALNIIDDFISIWSTNFYVLYEKKACDQSSYIYDRLIGLNNEIPKF